LTHETTGGPAGEFGPIRPAPHGPTAMADIIDRILRIPAKYRDYTIAAAHLQAQYAVDDVLRDQLLDLGLPHRGSGADRMFNGGDLENIGNALGLHSPGWRSLRMLAIMFGGLRDPAGTVYRVRSVSRCPAPRQAGPCAPGPSPLLLSAAPGEINCDATGVTAHLRLAPSDQRAGPVLDPLVQLAAGLTFHYLPDELTEDVGFAAETGLADCRLGACVLMAHADSVGQRLRAVSGLIMSVPFIMHHMWLEVEAGDGWLPIDPFFLSALAAWRILSPREWPPDRSTGQIYWPIRGAASPSDIHLVIDHGMRSQANVRLLNWRDIFTRA
jgi:hypothetical protein